MTIFIWIFFFNLFIFCILENKNRIEHILGTLGPILLNFNSKILESISDILIYHTDLQIVWGLQKTDFNRQTDRRTDGQTDNRNWNLLIIRIQNNYSLCLGDENCGNYKRNDKLINTLPLKKLFFGEGYHKTDCRKMC